MDTLTPDRVHLCPLCHDVTEDELCEECEHVRRLRELIDAPRKSEINPLSILLFVVCLFTYVLVIRRIS
jgi:hypothetical protein